MSEIQTYTPSNGAMLVCSSGGDYIKTKDHLATIARLEAEKAQKQLIIDDCKRNLKEQDATIASLTRELEDARGMCDLYVDEFHRIIAIADNSEIKGLCERAVFGIKQRIPLIEQRDNLEAENAALRAELADLKDGLTAAHMDGFASGKAEATEMLRKREGQLEELRAEVKAYREVEDSLQKEIKRLDAEAERLKAAERIRVAGLRETRDALVEKLRAEVERLKALENKMGSGWALVEYEKMQARAEQAEKELAAERGKSKCNHEWTEWTSTAGRTRQCIKCGQQYSWFG